MSRMAIDARIQAGREDDETVENSPRAESARRERRMRYDGNHTKMAHLKLAIPPKVQERLDREGKVARWMNDDGLRLADVERRDWDKSPDCEPVTVDFKDGKPIIAYLYEKYGDWYSEDKRRDGAMLNEMAQSIERGKAADGAGPNDPVLRPVKDTANRIAFSD